MHVSQSLLFFTWLLSMVRVTGFDSPYSERRLFLAPIHANCWLNAGKTRLGLASEHDQQRAIWISAKKSIILPSPDESYTRSQARLITIITRWSPQHYPPSIESMNCTNCNDPEEVNSAIENLWDLLITCAINQQSGIELEWAVHMTSSWKSCQNVVWGSGLSDSEQIYFQTNCQQKINGREHKWCRHAAAATDKSDRRSERFNTARRAGFRLIERPVRQSWNTRDAMPMAYQQQAPTEQSFFFFLVDGLAKLQNPLPDHAEMLLEICTLSGSPKSSIAAWVSKLGPPSNSGGSKFDRHPVQVVE